MTYHTDNRVRKYVQGYGFLSFAKKIGTKYGKKFVNKGRAAAKRFKTATKKFNQSKYDQAIKKEGLKVGKMAGKQISERIIPAAVDLAGSKIADKITSLKINPEEQQEEIQEEQEIIIPPEKRQQIIDDLRLF